MQVSLTEPEVGAIYGRLDEILKILSAAEGREASYAARRDTFKVIQFCGGSDVSKEVRPREFVKVDKTDTAPKSAFYFTKKEIIKMPTEFQKIFTVRLPVHVRRKPNGVYEARFRKYGYNIAVSSAHYEELKSKFLAALSSPSLPVEEQHIAAAADPFFRDVLERWLDLKRPTIKATTCKHYESLILANLLPVLGDRHITEIRQSDVQDLINTYTSQEKWRTASKIWQTLKAVFDFAVGEELLEKSPMRMLRPPKYEEQKGCALTLDEEREFVAKLAESGCADQVKDALLFLLYSGIRRSELASVEIEGGFVSVACSKLRKGYREKRRFIPVTPMLAEHLPANVENFCKVRPDALTQAFKRLMPEHHLHELRHTFITRCQECGVARGVVSVWAGHAADSSQTSNVYTHFSREFMLKEGKKVIYNL